jgi:hypothetical protein
MERSIERKTIMNFSASDIIRHESIKILSEDEITALFDVCSEKKLDPNILYRHDNFGRGFYALTVNKKRQH